jgi:DNA-binding CsgD family transcriptional regulator/tetratricopeptide (TPR) repeat protein
MELLERELYLATLKTALAEANAGTGRIVLVSGEAGIGKTSLVEQFTRSQQQSVNVWWGGCDSLFTPRPLGPLHDMAVQMQGELPALLSSNSNRAAIFSAVLTELQRRPTIVVFEDVHWADEATLDLLRFVGRRVARTSALLVMTYRDDELGPQHPLRSVLGDLSSSAITRRIPLPPLTEKAVQVLIGTGAMDAATLHRLTGGNPFFVTEILSSGSLGIPATIRDAVLARVTRLSSSGRTVMEAASVIGARIEPWLLRDVTGAEAYAVDECLSNGMLIAHGDLLGFRHELARQTILDTLPLHRKHVLHRLVFEALKLLPAARQDLARLAHHAEAIGDRAAVLEFAPAAARQAFAASAHREAAALYDLALRFADDAPPAERAQLLELYAQECNYIDRRGTGIEMLQKALDLWRELDRPVKQGEILSHQAAMHIGLGQDSEAERCSREAIEILEAHPSGHELVHAYRVQASLDVIKDNFAEAIAWAEKTIELADQIQDITEALFARNVIGTAWLSLDYERGCQLLEENFAAAHAAGRKSAAALAYANLGSVSSELHQFHRAERYLREGLAYTAEHDVDRLGLYILAWQAVTQLHLGYWNEAASAASAVVQQAGVSVTSRITALVALGRLRTRRGDPAADVALDEALNLSRSIAGLHRVVPVRAARAEAAWLANDRQRTLEEARAVYDLAVNRHHSWYAGELAYWRWRAGDEVTFPDWIAKPFALHIAGDWRAAAEEWERLGCPYERARALAEGDYHAQMAGLNIFERLGARPAADQLRHRIVARGAPAPRRPRSATRENPFGLTDRQVDILALLIEGLSNAEIATRLHISPKTADHHVSAVLAKLDVHSREAAADLAKQHPYFKL